jgi:hypothetical protein
MAAEKAPVAGGRTSLGDFAAARLGASEARRVLAFVLMWDDVRVAVGRPPTAAELAEWWGVNVSTMRRQTSRFRDCFGELTLEELVGRLDDVERGWRRLGVAGLAELESGQLGLRRSTGNAWRTGGLRDGAEPA